MPLALLILCLMEHFVSGARKAKLLISRYILYLIYTNNQCRDLDLAKCDFNFKKITIYFKRRNVEMKGISGLQLIIANKINSFAMGLTYSQRIQCSIVQYYFSCAIPFQNLGIFEFLL